MTTLEHLVDHPDSPLPPGARGVMFTAADGIRLRGAIFPALGRGNAGTVLLLHGRAEFIERLHETVRDLQIRGFTVATFDWRGQGGSERRLKNIAKGHVRSFRDYERDLDAAVTHLMAGLPQPWWLLAHSTGGLIAAAAEPKLTGVFRRAVFTAPFFGLGDFGIPDRLARILARTLWLVGFGRAWIPGGTARPVHVGPFEGNRLTSDPARFARNAALSTSHPELAVGSPTIAWLAGAFAAQRRLFRDEALDAYRLPTLILSGGADEVVSREAVESFVVRTRSTEQIVVPGARHELLQERDRFREQVWAAFDAFIPGSEPLPLPEAKTAPTSQGQEPQNLVVQPRIPGGDDAPALGGTPPGP